MISYSIKDEFIFIYSGMAETILVEALGLSYIGLQSDSMVNHIPEHLKEDLRGYCVVILSDNDDSFRNIIPKIRNFFEYSDVIVIDFENLLDRELPKGYDFRDFCNEIKEPKDVATLSNNGFK